MNTIQLRIEKIIPGGKGLSRHEGRVIFIPRVLAGELVEVHITKKKKDWAEAELVNIIESSGKRVTPPCPHASDCGGCDFIHMSYASQLEYKKQMLADSLQRLAGESLPEHFHIEPSREWNYRNRARIHQLQLANGRKIQGYKERQGRQIVDIEECPVLVREARGLWNKDYRIDGQGFRQREVKVFASPEGMHQDPTDHKGPSLPFEIECVGKAFHLSNDVFFQSNISLLPQMVDFVQGGILKDNKVDLAMDLFAGVGFFSVFLQERAHKVVAVERDKKCLKFARKNTRKNVEFYTGAVEDWAPQQSQPQVDFIVVDPPREGMDKSIPALLAKWAPQELVYISCNPVTFARDLKSLKECGFELQELTGFDLYPQTHHLELGARFTF